MRTRHIAALLIGTLVASSALARPSPEAESKLALHNKRLQAAYAECSAETAAPIDFADIFGAAGDDLALNSAYDMACVSVSGIVSYRRLVPDQAAPYRLERDGRIQNKYVDFSADMSAGRPFRAKGAKLHIGLAGYDVMTDAGLTEHNVDGRAVGVLTSCSGFNMGGYCHYQAGPIMHLVAVDGEPIVKPVRYVGEEARRELGNLRFMSDDDVLKSGLGAAFDDWVMAIARGDKQGFNDVVRTSWPYEKDVTWNRFSGFTSSEEVKSHYLRGLWSAFFDPSSVYRSAGFEFGERRHFEVFHTMAEDSFLSDTVSCICVTDDCDGRWPLSTHDLRNVSSDMMICVTPQYKKPDPVMLQLPELTERTDVQYREWRSQD